MMEKVLIKLSKKQIDKLLTELDLCTLIKQGKTKQQRLEQSIVAAISDWFQQREYWRKYSDEWDANRTIFSAYLGMKYGK